jgi:hypothetical protein
MLYYVVGVVVTLMYIYTYFFSKFKYNENSLFVVFVLQGIRALKHYLSVKHHTFVDCLEIYVTILNVSLSPANALKQITSHGED